MSTTMVSEPLIYSRRLASGLRRQKRERETLTLEKRSVKRGGLTFSSACSASPAPRSRAASTFVGNRGKSDARVSTRGVAAVSLLRDARAIHEDRWAFKGHVAAPGWAAGAGAAGHVAAPGWAAGAGAAGHVVAPELPWSMRFILPIGKITKVSPIGLMFPIGRSERYCRSAK
jgi:hypothetical protein